MSLLIYALQDASSPLLRSDAAFQLYLTSLVNNGLQSSINSAVRRRESLLASTAVETALSSDLSHVQSESGILDSSPTITDAASTTDLSTPSLSRSQQIAQAVLSGKTPTPSYLAASAQGNSPSADMAQLAKHLASGAGSQGSPIHVTLSDGKYLFSENDRVGGKANTRGQGKRR